MIRAFNHYIIIREKMVSKKIKIAIRVSLLMLVAAISGFVGGRYLADNKLSCFKERYVLYVYPDALVEEVIDSLCSGAGALRRGSLVRAARKESLNENMKPGRYDIDPSCSAIYVARMLSRGWQTPQNLTLSGTLRKKERIAQVIGRQMMIDSIQVAQALDDTSFLAQYGFTPENVFGLILPDTYQMYWTDTIDEIFSRFKKEYDAFWTEERVEASKIQGLTPMEASIMASIVSGETLKAFEYPKIAGVYLNRLHNGMLLQADPTVAFCHGYTLDRIYKKHLKIDSPYNTYRYKGLPPAPINVPPKACIEAVLHPDTHGYLYFCASPAFDGTHRFASSYNVHLQNAREFHRALTERRRSSAK